jgi:glycerophosphoryl diester phosphodiesterase
VVAFGAAVPATAVPLPSGSRVAASRHLRDVVNVVHRGASAYAPENSLAAVRKAIARDCDLVEVDEQRS